MNIEAGKYYFDRKDIAKGPMLRHDSPPYAWTDGNDTWAANGRFDPARGKTPFDLVAEAFVSREPPPAQTNTPPNRNMTVRQLFVLAAMEGLCAGFFDRGGVAREDEQAIAHHASRIADATLAEEERTRK